MILVMKVILVKNIEIILVKDIEIIIIKDIEIIIRNLVGIKNGVIYIFFIITSYIYYVSHLYIKLFNISNN